jgi:hypothetical protein
MNILEKTRADLSIALYFYTPCINLTDIVFALYLYDNWGKSEMFFDILDSHRREFDNFKVVSEIIREFMNAGQSEKKAEKTDAQKVKTYVENEKVYKRLTEAGEDSETVGKVRRVQEKFQGRFVS